MYTHFLSVCIFFISNTRMLNMRRTPQLPPGHTLAPMRDDEINQLAQWAATEGWNPGRSDLAIARRIDPNACLA